MISLRNFSLSEVKIEWYAFRRFDRELGPLGHRSLTAGPVLQFFVALLGTSLSRVVLEVSFSTLWWPI